MGKIEITTKYNIGDKFFCAFNTTKKCPYCKRRHPFYTVAEVEITNIGFYDPKSPYYSVSVEISKTHRFSTGYVGEHIFCETRQEAQQRCDRRNVEFLSGDINYYDGYFG